MNRRRLLFGLAGLGGALAAPGVLLNSRPAEAVTPQTQMQPLVREDYYPSFERRYPNIPGTNFRPARPEEYPYHFYDDCGIGRRGRTLFGCDNFVPRKRRQPKRN